MISKNIIKLNLIALIGFILFGTVSLSAEDVPRRLFVRTYSNPHLAVVAFSFNNSGKCSIEVDNDPSSSKTEKYACTWKQIGKSNKLNVTWLSEKYKKDTFVPPEGDIYYLILDGDSPETRRYCLVKKPADYNSDEFRTHDIFELSNGVPLCSDR